MIHQSNFHNITHPKRLVLGSLKAKGVDFRYATVRYLASIIFVNDKERDNTHDWLIAINHFTLNQTTPSNDSNDRFGMNLGYDDQQNNGLSGTPIGLMLGADPYYNGNVSWVMYRIHGVEYSKGGYPIERAGYVYRYDAAVRHPASIIDFNNKERDKANRLTRGEFAGELYGEWFGGNAYNERDISHHKNGNLTGLKRYDQYGTVLHDYSYVYYNNTNRLRRVTGSGNNYDYDHKGNMIQDLANGIGFVIYDIHNLPVRVFTTDGAPWDYAYDQEGNRVRTYNGVETNYYIHGIDGRTEVVTDKASSWATYNLYGLDLIGQIRREGATWNRFYFLKDHLGSVRVIVDASGNVVSYDDYYPFGMVMPGRTQDSSAVDGRYKFTGKERDTETKYDYFGARYYDARIGRWLQVDPMAEKYFGISPYAYCLNNPISLIDIDGNQSKDANGGEPKKIFGHFLNTIAYGAQVLTGTSLALAAFGGGRFRLVRKSPEIGGSGILLGIHGLYGSGAEMINTAIEVNLMLENKLGINNPIINEEMKLPSGLFELFAIVSTNDPQVIEEALKIDVTINLLTTTHTTYGMPLAANQLLGRLEKLTTSLKSLHELTPTESLQRIIDMIEIHMRSIEVQDEIEEDREDLS